MIEILSTTTPLYLCVLVGYVLTRIGFFRRSDADLFGKFVLNVAMPALMFTSISSSPASVINPTYFVGYGLASLLAVSSIYAYSRFVVGGTSAAAAMDGLGAAASNSGFVGYPLLMIVLPAVAGPVFGMNVLIELLVTLPLAYFFAGLGRPGVSLGRQMLASLGRVVRMPIMIALVLGVVVSSFGWRLPAPLASSVDIFGRTSTALALFAVGGMLVGLTVRGNLHRILAASAGKLILMPALAFAAATVLALTPMPALGDDLTTALILSAAMPVWSSLSVYALPYGERDVPPAVLLLTTAGSFFTLSLLLALLR